MSRLPHLTIFFLVIFGLFNSVRAQTHANISDEKRKLIAQLISVMKMDEQIGKITDTILQGMQDSFPVGFNAAVDARADLTPDEKAQIKAREETSFVSFSEKFRKRLPEVVDYQRYIQESIYPLYDKFYNEQELQDLIAFYSTPTGQKVIETMPQLLAESQIAAREKLLPQIVPLLQALSKEEIDNAARPKPAKRPN